MKTFLSSKIHGATITGSEVDYQGSIAISKQLAEVAGIEPYEQVHVYSMTTGVRLITYALIEDVSGMVEARGASAKLLSKGEKVIICSYETLQRWQEREPTQIIVESDDNEKYIIYSGSRPS